MNLLKIVMIHYCLMMVFCLAGSSHDDYNGFASAIHDNDLPQVRRLVARSADVNQGDYAGWTPLMLATSYENLGITNFLLVSKANINQQNNNNSTALHIAAMKGNESIVNNLLMHRADHTLVNESGCTPLLNAARDKDCNKEVLRLLIDAKSDINLKSKNGEIALLKAKKVGRYDVVGLFLARGADYDEHSLGDIEKIIQASDAVDKQSVFNRIIDPIMYESTKFPREIVALVAEHWCSIDFLKR